MTRVVARAASTRALRAFFLTSTALLSASPVKAADWLGTTSNSWFLAGNWSPATVPTAATAVAINSNAIPNLATISTAGAAAQSVILGANPGQSGTLNVSGGGLTVTTSGPFPAGYILVGNYGAGSMTVDNGGTVTASNSYIAANAATANGTVTVTGAGSKWSTGYFDVGSSGNGTLNVRDTATVNATAGIGIGSDNGAVGVINVESGGKVTTTDTTIASPVGSTGTLNVNGLGSSWSSSSSTIVGQSGTGALNVLNGASLNSGNLTIGPTGTMTISNGGKVTSTSGPVPAARVNGTANVTGANSQWIITGDPSTGNYSTLALGVAGSLTVDNGGKVVIQNTATGTNGSAAALRIGTGTSASTVTITGAGSALTTPYDQYVGYAVNSNATVNVNSGATLNSGTTYIAHDTGSKGTVNVTGANSVWTISDTQNVASNPVYGVSVGERGTGVLTIANGGVVNVNSVGSTLNLGGFAGSKGTLNIGADAASPAAAAGTLNATKIQLSPSSNANVINFNHTSNNYIFSPVITGNNGTLNFLAGKTILAGDNIFGGTTTISAGATAQIGNGENTRIITGAIANDGVLIFKTSRNETYGSVISGNGSVEQQGQGTNSTITFTNNNTYTGGTTITSGTLKLGNGGTTGSVVGDIVNNSHLSFDRSDSFTFSNLISGTGDVDKRGAGILTLNTAQTYTGGTSVSVGTLKLGNSNRLASTGNLFISGGATFDLAGFSQTVGAFSGPGTAAIGAGSLTFGNNLDRTFQGNITGNGSFIKQGTGSFTMLANNSAYTGTTTVNNGLLAVNGNLSNSATTVNTGGTLGGTGVVGQTTVNGTIAPGNSIGTLNVNGPYIQNAGSFYNVEVNGAGQSDLINVNGTATINGGTVRVLAGIGAYNPTTVYTILTSNGVRSGTYDAVTSNFAFLDPSLTYDPNNVYLTLIRNSVDFTSIGGTQNQMAAGGGVQALGLGNAIVNSVLTLSADQARSAFDSLSGEIHPSLHSLMLNDSALVRDAIFNRERQGSGLATGNPQVLSLTEDDSSSASSYATKASKAKTPKWPIKAPAQAPVYEAWVQGYGNWGHINGDGNAATLNYNSAGAVAGVDVTLDRNWRFGFAAGGGSSNANVNARSSSGTLDTVHVAAYGSGSIGEFVLRTGAAYSHHDISTSRTIAFPGFGDMATASYNADTTQIFGEAARRLTYGWVATEAFGNVAYVSVHSDGFTEAGGPAALSVAASTTAATFTTLGLRGQAPVAFVGPWAVIARGSLGWQHAFGDTTPQSLMSFAAAPSPFTIAGVPIGRDMALVEAGLDAKAWQNTLVSLIYSGRLANDASAHAVKANVTVKF